MSLSFSSWWRLYYLSLIIDLLNLFHVRLFFSFFFYSSFFLLSFCVCTLVWSLLEINWWDPSGMTSDSKIKETCKLWSNENYFLSVYHYEVWFLHFDSIILWTCMQFIQALPPEMMWAEKRIKNKESCICT